MAVTQSAISVVFTASGDSLNLPVLVKGIGFSGSGLTAAQEVIVTDFDGHAIASHVITAANDNAELLTESKWYNGLKVSGTIGGTWKLIFRLG